MSTSTIRRGFTLFACATVTLLAAVAAPGPAHAQEGTVLGAGAPGAIKDSYLVVLKRSPGAPVTDVAARHRVSTVRHTYRSALAGFSATMSEQRARQLAADPDVAFVEQDRVVSATGEQVNPASWGLDRIDQLNLPLDGRYGYPDGGGSSVHAYVIDTGIRTTHTQFGGRASSGFDAVDGGTADDCDGHGTHVAGTIGGTDFGVAKAVQLVAVRVLDCFGNGSLTGIVAGVDWVTANHVKPAVANMSLGGPASATIDAAVNGSINAGVTYTVAAGNDGGDACNLSPARVQAAITVGASDRADALAGFSSRGRCLDVVGPGVDILSAGRASDTATATESGTSMAAPHVAGIAALILQVHPTMSPFDVAANLVADGSTKITDGGNLLRAKLVRVIHGPISGLGGKCVDVRNGQTANNTAVQLFDCNGTPFQEWFFTGRTLVNPVSGRCLDLAGGGTLNGTPALIFDCNRGSTQQWTRRFGTGGLGNVGAQRCLDVPGANPTSGIQLQIFDCNGGAAQRWVVPQN